ncbi:MAG: CapA family protein [Gammaproteobacteria bacterium]|nr:CapA family protein [Gammaproteobacteria bacterium]
MFLCGDVMTGRGIDQVLPQSVSPQLYEPYVRYATAYVNLAESRNGPIPAPVDYDYIWGDAMDVLEQRAPAARIINLETAVTTNDEPWPDKSIHYRMHPENVRCLTAAGIDCCVLANNHLLDWGHRGLQETLATLQEAGIRTAGAGLQLKQATAPAIINTARGRILVFAFGHPGSGIPGDWRATGERGGINLLTDMSDAAIENIAEDIAAVRRPGDIVVLSIHWGGNWGYGIPLEQQRFARSLIDTAGVDIVHGHSSHHPKGIEIHNNRLILYGCGDFLNDYEGIEGHEAYRGELTLMVFPCLDRSSGELLKLELVPMRIAGFRLQHANDDEASWLAGMLDREGRKLGTSAHLTAAGTIDIHAMD